MADGTTGPGNGITGGYKEANPVILRAMMAFTAIAWYNSIELIVLVFATFKHYSGVYFWSLLITSIAIIPYSAGAWLKQVAIGGDSLALVSVSTVGWLVLIPGQSIVLWSRLHCLTQDQRLLKGILAMIIIDTLVLCIPTTVLGLGSNSTKAAIFVHGYAIMERIQMTCFTAQELIISLVYLIEVRRILSVTQDGKFRKLMWELVAINVAIIIMDVALLGIEYVSLYQVEVTLKGVVYSIKLKLEFAVLSKLVKIATSRQGVYNLDGEGSNSDGSNTTTIDQGGILPTLSTMTKIPTNSTFTTYTTSSPTVRDSSGRLDSELSPNIEKYRDFETRVSFSQAEPIPKPSPVQQVTSDQTVVPDSRRSSTQYLYPGRLD